MVYGTDREAAAIPKVLADRKITFPLLLDAESAYRKASNIATYPSATLVGPDGRIAWEGQPFWRKKFADACEEQIERLLAVTEKR